MDRAGLILGLAFTIIVSGCVQIPDKKAQGKPGSLKILEFSVSDSSITAGGQAVINLKLRNHHKKPVSPESISLYNLGILKLKNPENNWQKRCSPDELAAAKEGIYPEMQCEWIIRAPKNLEGFESKQITFNLNLEYPSRLSNRLKPLKIKFKPLEKISNSRTNIHTYSNGEVKMTLKNENPAPRESSFIDISVESIGKGRVTSNYEMNYKPKSLFQNCPKTLEKEDIFQGKAAFSCKLSPPSSEASVTRNVVISTSYKYTLSPSIDVEVVKP